MSRLAVDLARALDPVRLARTAGMIPDPWQESVLRTTHPRVLLNCCRQSGKSTTSALKALHVAVYEPGSLILLVSPSQRQSSELFRKVLTFYRALGRPVPAESENALSLTLESGSRVVSLPGTESTIRSYSAARLLIVDEAARVEDELLAAVRPMLAVSQGQLIALSTPWGMRGWWYEAWTNGGPRWERVRVTADECPRISADFLDEEKAIMGEWFYRQEYLCEFSDSVTALFPEQVITRMLNPAIEPFRFTGGS